MKNQNATLSFSLCNNEDGAKVLDASFTWYDLKEADANVIEDKLVDFLVDLNEMGNAKAAGTLEAYMQERIAAKKLSGRHPAMGSAGQHLVS